MKIAIVCLFPDYFYSPFKYAPIRKALDKEIVDIKFFSPIDYAKGPKDVEDYQYGGGEGMVLKVEYMVKALEDAKKFVPSAPVFLMSATGKRLSQEDLKEISKLPEIILIGGHYKGIDSRIYDFIDVELSIGDFVISSGELAILVLIDGVIRLLEGVLTHPESAKTDSFYKGFLEPPIYTRPYDFLGKKVPDVLLSGHHEKIALWRREQEIKRTLLFRPDILKKVELDDKDKEILKKIYQEISDVISNLKIPNYDNPSDTSTGRPSG